MAIVLTVIHPWHGYARGKEITDPAEIAEVLAKHEKRVVKKTAPDAPASQ